MTITAAWKERRRRIWEYSGKVLDHEPGQK